MRIFRYWAADERKFGGNTVRLLAGSNVSADDAAERLRRKARAFDRIYSAARPIREEDLEELRRELRALDEVRDDDEYSTEIREEIVDEIGPRNLVTRNRYGAKVINTEEVCFIDVDEVVAPFGMALSRLFGHGPKTPADVLLAIAARLVARPENSDLGFRVYQTAAGFRVIATGRNLTPRGRRTDMLFRAFHADPRYVFLCHAQGCFRARVTPKPSRVHCRRFPKGLFPAQTDAQRATLKAWTDEYEKLSVRSAVCRLLGTCGVAFGGAVISYHDQATAANDTRAKLA